MSATLGGALKAYLEAQGLKIAVYSGRVKKGAKRPYLQVAEDITLVLDGMEDGTAATGTELLLLDLWQTLEDENPALPDAIEVLVEGFRCVYGTPPKIVYGLLVRNRRRFEELAEMASGPQVSLVHHAYDVDAKREVKAIALA